MKNDRTFLDKLLDGAGVEWKPLGKITDIKTGQPVSKHSISQNPGIYPVINSGREPLGFINEWNTEDDPIGITTRGAGVGSITWQKGKYFRGNLNYSVTIKSQNELSIRFLYHILLHFQKEIHNLCSFTGIPALNASELKKLIIPVPPLHIQTEIVRILDTLTALTSELTSELILRQKQYEYYREKLLSFDSLERLNKGWAKEKLIGLGEIGSIRMCKRILKNQTSSIGDIPFYKIGTFGKEPDAYISKELFQEYKQKYSYPKKGDILISASGTIGRTVVFDGKDAYFQDSNIVWVENDERIVLNKYLFHFYKIAKWGAAEGGTIQRLYNDNLRKVKIPVPPLEEQHRIVSILDKFETLTNSITEGLPLAIEQSQKRYEYYRELLLSFPKLDN
ncbi:restriction endonuclease subunit S [Aggregatibacter actinomycetemcomitans]|uniref:restriction endonuclease subunit S n=1 Tax=Aggregatibacter actinomycetemcomitans TaxID=714 RepID=UPI00197C5A29|nr:restriction endonuclease subunit S [Aggregatibacter actinomycetemcomitans]MBN6064144.1 restriction endonuclease subunit S [Aggregatibacter actinomycetemcomitans]MBN6083987.1 restriction endonuclease subunit S [Aggregatibacter actinomycetemcomitans]